MGNRRSISQSDQLRALLVVSVCLLVFSLTLSAKLSAYRDQAGACDPLANTKLCLNGVKMDMQATFTPLLVLWLVSLTVLISFALHKTTATPAVAVVPPQQAGHTSEHCARPPPAPVSKHF